jgi:ABC-type sugar transport system ATPase subunit
LQVGDFALSDVSFAVPTGGYGVLMGKTGSGKTTLLESIIGLRRIRGGRVLLHGVDVTELKPAVRGVGYVPQDGALFSTMTVREQIALALVIRKVSRTAIDRRVDELAELLGIAPLLHRKPRGLSGGERQRVALGRALSFQPGVLCLDEPLSALDDDTRQQMCELLQSVQKRTHVTVLHVTHNRAEAQLLGDCLLRIEDGQVRRLKPPSDHEA